MWLASGVTEAHGIRYELRGWLMTFLRKLAICAGEYRVGQGMSYVTG